MKSTWLRYFHFLLACTLLVSCGSTPSSNFYTLSGMSPSGEKIVSKKAVSIRVGPFRFPDYLDRPNVITRTTQNRLHIAEFHRWAGSLENDFHRTLGTNLGVLLNTPRISIYPADIRFHINYYIIGEVILFDGGLNKQVKLEVRWSINRKNDRKAIIVQHSVISEPVNGEGYAPLIESYQRVVDQLSREIANTIRTQIQ